MATKAEPDRDMVLRGLYELDFERRDVRVTAEQVARYLKFDVEQIAPFLRELKRKRMIKTAKRQGETIWMPWRGQRA